MELKYEEVSEFARKNGNVTALAKRGTVTLLKSGEVDAFRFLEKEAVQFVHLGKTYTRKEFEKLVRSDGSKRA